MAQTLPRNGSTITAFCVSNKKHIKMCNGISKESLSKGIHRVSSGRSNVSVNNRVATGKCFTAFGVKTITVSHERVAEAGRIVLKSRK